MKLNPSLRQRKQSQHLQHQRAVNLSLRRKQAIPTPSTPTSRQPVIATKEAIPTLQHQQAVNL